MNGPQAVNQAEQYLSEQELFAHLKCEVLESLRQSLTTSLIPDRHMDFLRSKYILSEEDCDEINHPPTRKKKASKFLDILGKKGAEAYDALCASLKEEGTQTFLLKQLHEDFERRLRQYRELVGQQNQQQGLPLISPPPIQPLPPPSHLHHGKSLQPMEHNSPGGTTPPLSPSSVSCSSCASPMSNGTSYQASQSTEALHDHTIVRQCYQHPRLSSRGSSQEFDLLQSPVEGGSTGLPNIPVPATSKQEPIENEDVTIETSSLQEPSFFRSLADGSLVSSSSGAACNSRQILCDAALHDQQKALSKCAASYDNVQVEREDNSSDATGASNTDEPFVELSCLSAAHATEREVNATFLPTPVSTWPSPETDGICSSEQHTLTYSTAPTLDCPTQAQVARSGCNGSAEQTEGSGNNGVEIVEGLTIGVQEQCSQQRGSQPAL